MYDGSRISSIGNILSIRILARACFLSMKRFRHLIDLSKKLKDCRSSEVNRVFEKYAFISCLSVNKCIVNFFF
jgi:hypothetical protein